jgi:hypothetical protein
MRDKLNMKEKLLKAAVLTKATEERLGVLETALRGDLAELASYRVDGSVLKNSQIVAHLKIITKAGEHVPKECKKVIQAQLNRWKEQILSDSSVTRITNAKGGKVVEIPKAFDKPKELSARLWQVLQENYNASQLYAIYYVITQHQPTATASKEQTAATASKPKGEIEEGEVEDLPSPATNVITNQMSKQDTKISLIQGNLSTSALLLMLTFDYFHKVLREQVKHRRLLALSLPSCTSDYPIMPPLLPAEFLQNLRTIIIDCFFALRLTLLLMKLFSD